MAVKKVQEGRGECWAISTRWIRDLGEQSLDKRVDGVGVTAPSQDPRTIGGHRTASKRPWSVVFQFVEAPESGDVHQAALAYEAAPGWILPQGIAVVALRVDGNGIDLISNNFTGFLHTDAAAFAGSIVPVFASASIG